MLYVTLSWQWIIVPFLLYNFFYAAFQYSYHLLFFFLSSGVAAASLPHAWCWPCATIFILNPILGNVAYVYFRSLGWILIIKDWLSFFIITITTFYWYYRSPLLNLWLLFFILIQETLFRSLCSIDLVMLNMIHIDTEWKMMQLSYICKIVWVFRDHWCKKAFINVFGVLVHV